MIQTILIPTRENNYAVLIRDETTKTTALVDAPEAAPIMAELAKRGWQLNMILITHRHSDHVEGIPELVAHSGAKVIAPALAQPSIPNANRYVKEGDEIEIGSLIAKVWEIPGHCEDHVGYYLEEISMFFAGDTLFTMGCGRILGSNPEALFQSLTRIAALPQETQIYSGHEYSLVNARFCAQMENDNPRITARLSEIEARIARGKPCVPTTVKQERETNVFLRAADVATFTALREARNKFSS